MTLKYVQIETTTVCNQRCYFCPVSLQKRAKEKMSMAIFDQIVEGIRGYSLENVHMSGFNEPTYDKQLVERVARLNDAGFKVLITTNASGLKPALTMDLLKAGVTTFVINLSTLDEKQYFHNRGTHDLKRVKANLQFLLAEIEKQNAQTEVKLLIVGHLDKEHGLNIQEVMTAFSYSTVPDLVISPLSDFAGKPTDMLSKSPFYHKILRGCATGRQNQWLHFVPSGDAILCCQDYLTHYKIGNITRNSAIEIEQGEQLRQFQRWVSGEESAPEDFICRTCVFALSDENYADKLKKLFCQFCVLPNELGIEKSCQYCVISSQLINYQ
jgi:radical SAM protein with 4Fe4S-binding SPASM domain